MPFHKEILHGVLVKTHRLKERGETDPEGGREHCDKTWLSLAVGNYLPANATTGNPSGSMEKDEDERLKKKTFEEESRDIGICDIAGS